MRLITKVASDAAHEGTGVHIGAGVLMVTSSQGGGHGLWFVRRVCYADGVTIEEDLLEDAKEFIALMWPESDRGKAIAPLKNGLTLCDATQATRSPLYAIGLLALGQELDWWKLVYDENVICQRNVDGSHGPYCTLRIESYQAPPRRPPKRKEVRAPAQRKFQFPGLPERGIAIA